MNSTDKVASDAAAVAKEKAKEMAKVAVIGAGMAGLTAAQRLIAAGVEVTLIDKAHAPGGRASTLERDSFYLNQGPHALYRGGAAFQILDDLDDMEKDGTITEDDLEKGKKQMDNLTKEYVDKVDAAIKAKSTEIMAD